MHEFAVGDIVEIETMNGLIYAQITHDHPSYPPVVVVFDGAFDRRPDHTQSITGRPPRFTALISLASALSRLGKQVTLLANEQVSDPFPIFRTPVRDKLGEIIYWWLWDGRSLAVDTGTSGPNRDAPLREVMGAAEFWRRLEDQPDQDG
ncbi:hypothetical protein [uncultured Boseongicola sp.]|jgi:hypothetical protein|uniref:hypothetical protein n=1 Tax=uncultured Boseongicola sp. TaxID=1648499 RepID=UPI0026269466|nr:hypothetical protein [uncultured Boseongicola sp.]